MQYSLPVFICHFFVKGYLQFTTAARVVAQNTIYSFIPLHDEITFDLVQ